MRSTLLNLSLEGSPIANPVIPGDHPDPTILRVGDRYFASATSGEWSPQFPLFESPDLVHWSLIGSIFPIQPAWAEGSFWAPELVHDGSHFLAYYVARARNGPLSIAVATAGSPRGPWTDHGPILAEPLGSIDPAFIRDENGKPFLIWKTDGNSQGQPTPIWAQPLAPDLLHLTGTPTQLITNDAPWEGGVVEGPYILPHEDRFYLFYAGNACCGRECQYAEGVARADHLLGPWTKNPANPIVAENQGWRCPGHGTIVHGHTAPGETYQDYLLYHAYPREGTIYIGREAILDKIDWSADGWPSINAGTGPTELPANAVKASASFLDNFDSPTLAPSWQWPVNTRPNITTGREELHLTIPAKRQSAMVAIAAPGVPGYTAMVELCVAPEPRTQLSTDSDQPPTPTYNDPPTTTWAGLSIVGDPFNTIGLGLRSGVLELWHRTGDTQHTPWSTPIQTTDPIHLRATTSGDLSLEFFYSLDNAIWTPAGPPIDARDLPAWDRGLRIGLMLEGPGRSTAIFRHFALNAG